MKALGVPQFRAHLRGELALEAAIVQAQQATRNYAKRQVTWFKNQLLPRATATPEGLARGEFTFA
ncbi:MAG TPA: tRNA (adenosine(37)-N6)-dimethylallyltransferase MiaA, partial [Alphaproteobacteria bacterium]|nr:tRNA (adenosine(37)-N6)-dimethylallyltransferase MiaA [Alphaproteobacteria bacterium]